MNNQLPSVEELAEVHDALKCTITQILWDFTDQYAAPKSKFYPYVLPVMADVLSESLSEVKRQQGIKDA